MESRKHYTGLTGKQVLESREKHGANVLTPPKRDSLWQIFIGNFEDPVIRILMVAVFLSGGIAISMYFSEGVIEIAETIGIAVAILLATGVATWFVWDANKKFDVLNQVNDDTLVKVIRDGDVHRRGRYRAVGARGRDSRRRGTPGGDLPAGERIQFDRRADGQ